MDSGWKYDAGWYDVISISISGIPSNNMALQYNVDLADKVRKSKVLVVGAGGIGCELLKNLVLTGFHDIHVVNINEICSLSLIHHSVTYSRTTCYPLRLTWTLLTLAI